MEFRKTNTSDIETLGAILNYYILNTTATFYTKPLSIEQLNQTFLFENSKFASFTIYSDIQIAGYVSLAQHKAREAYHLTAEVSVYLDTKYTHLGIGSKAIEFIEQYAIDNGFHTLIATICGENSDSIRLFTRHGYIKCAHYQEVGRKFDRFLDVVALQKML